MSFKTAFSFSHRSAIQQRLIRHQKLLNIVLSVSPIQIQPHIKDCVINEHKLLVYVSSAVWASQLRFFHSQIKEAVNRGSAETIINIRIRILSPEPYKIERQAIKRVPSTQTIAFIADNAESVTEGKLKDALLKLSHTLQHSHQ